MRRFVCRSRSQVRSESSVGMTASGRTEAADNQAGFGQKRSLGDAVQISGNRSFE